jgi:hypothetical protein
VFINDKYFEYNMWWLYTLSVTLNLSLKQLDYPYEVDMDKHSSLINNGDENPPFRSSKVFSSTEKEKLTKIVSNNNVDEVGKL